MRLRSALAGLAAAWIATPDAALAIGPACQIWSNTPAESRARSMRKQLLDPVPDGLRKLYGPACVHAAVDDMVQQVSDACRLGTSDTRPVIERASLAWGAVCPVLSMRAADGKPDVPISQVKADFDACMLALRDNEGCVRRLAQRWVHEGDPAPESPAP